MMCHVCNKPGYYKCEVPIHMYKYRKSLSKAQPLKINKDISNLMVTKKTKTIILCDEHWHRAYISLLNGIGI